MRYCVLDDVHPTWFDNYEDAQGHFYDLINFYDHYGASHLWWHSDKVLVNVFDDEFFIQILSEKDYISTTKE